MIYTDPKLAPGGAGPGDPPETAASGVGVHRHAGDVVPPPAGLGTATGTAGTVSASGEGACRIPSPALFPGAPIPGPPTIIPGRRSAERRWHAAARDAGARRPAATAQVHRHAAGREGAAAMTRGSRSRVV